MFEVDFLPVGEASRSGDAICMRFTRPDTGGQAVVVIDAGFETSGDALVEHIKTFYRTTVVDLAILTHPDGDHIGGMGKLVRGLSVRELWLHDIGAHGGATLPAAKAVDDLIAVATGQGVAVREAWAGASRFGGAITVLGPTKDYYEQLVQEQVDGASARSSAAASLVESARSLLERVTTMLGIETPFEAKEVNPRNNSSMIVRGLFDDRPSLFTADAGVPALDAAWDYAESAGIADTPVMTQLAHHGSRRNCSSAWLDRLLGPTGQTTGTRTAIASCASKSAKHPSGRVINAHKRRGCDVVATAGGALCHNSGGLARPNWGPATPLGPMVEEPDED